MKLYIDYMNFVIEYASAETPSVYWKNRHVLIDTENLERSHVEYLDLVRKEFPTSSSKLSTFEEFQDRIVQFYDRKKEGKSYYLDLVHKDHKLTASDELTKLRLSVKPKKVKNVGTQLHLNLFD